MNLEKIVLPLPECRSLVEHGIVLDTAMVWVRDDDDQHISVVERSRTEDILDLKGEVTILCGAPVLSELLGAIRERQPYAVVQCGNRPHGYVGSARCACSAMQPEGCSDIRYGDTDLLAACALLLEVAQ